MWEQQRQQPSARPIKMCFAVVDFTEQYIIYIYIYTTVVYIYKCIPL